MWYNKSEVKLAIKVFRFTGKIICELGLVKFPFEYVLTKTSWNVWNFSHKYFQDIDWLFILKCQINDRKKINNFVTVFIIYTEKGFIFVSIEAIRFPLTVFRTALIFSSSKFYFLSYFQVPIVDNKHDNKNDNISHLCYKSELTSLIVPILTVILLMLKSITSKLVIKNLK